MAERQGRVIVIDLTTGDDTPEVRVYKKRRALGDITRETQNVQNGGEPSTWRRRGRQRSSSEDAEEDAENRPAQGRGLTGNEGYCVKCRQKRPMRDAKEITTANHRKALQGKCSICGTKMMRFIK